MVDAGDSPGPDAGDETGSDAVDVAYPDAGDASGSDADDGDSVDAPATDVTDETPAGSPDDASTEQDVGDAESSESAGDSHDPEPAGPATGRRTVIVPESLFRIVVVFSTVLSILAILLGFVLLDTATGVVENPPGSVVVDMVRWAFGLSLSAVDPHLSTIALLVGLLGVGCIGLGIWIYAIGTRFRTEMGKPKEHADEESDNG